MIRCDRRIVLYGVGSPLVIDAEESCARAHVEVVAGVRNMEGSVYVTSAVHVVQPVELTDAERACGVLCVLFTPGHRRGAFVDAQRVGFTRGATLIDPTSPVARSATVGQGVFINAACVVAGGCELGDWVLVNRSASIGHHARIGTYASIGPGVVLAGNVSIGRGAVIGAGAVVLPEVTIGDNAVVAAGSVVRDAVPPHSLVAGNPCRVTKIGIEGYKGFSI
ncbi:MAG TPA: DapH/DapD/GlmU-related protein [Casimicrobiaceae bacterium]|nr:DapH/DapD/GlmU-related protein [Casimicrobiaceae bacterium]